MAFTGTETFSKIAVNQRTLTGSSCSALLKMCLSRCYVPPPEKKSILEMRLQVEEQTNCLGVVLKEVAGDHLCSLPPTEWDRNTGGKPRNGSRWSLEKSNRKVQQTQTQVSSFFKCSSALRAS